MKDSGGWISTQHQHPSEGTNVLVYAPASQNLEGDRAVAWWDSDGEWYSSVLTEYGTPVLLSGVEAWMPLPEYTE